MQKIKLYNAHCCGEIGDVVVGLEKINYNSPKEASIALFKDKKWRNFFLNEPRGGVFKHCNIIVKPSNLKADAGFVIMEPEDNPPMSGSNSICVATVLLEKNFLKMNSPFTKLKLEAPGGLIKIVAECIKNRVKNVSITNLPSFVDQLDFELKTKEYGNIIVSTAYGGDSFLLCNAKDFNLKIIPENANSFVKIAKNLLQEANSKIGFNHPEIPELNYISFCQFMEPLTTDNNGQKTMTYECKVFDKNGKLKKILRESELSKSSKKLFNQSSTKKITSFINRFKEPTLEPRKQTKFYNKICVVCQKEFHPRHPNSKYCSHECQKSLYLARKKKGDPG